MKNETTIRLLALLFAALVTGGAASPAAADEPSPFVAPDGEALVVFIQNDRDDRKMTFLVFVPSTECVAELSGREAELVPMAPGKYSFFVGGYDTRRIEIDLEAGRTYFIRVYSRDRFATRSTEVTPARRGTDSYKELKTWLDGAEVTHAREDQCRGKPIEGRPRQIQKGIMAANVDWKDGDDVFRAKYSLS
ncbi:MAG: hypothetical protein WCF10_08155 [Polyangiales bacterium]